MIKQIVKVAVNSVVEIVSFVLFVVLMIVTSVVVMLSGKFRAFPLRGM